MKAILLTSFNLSSRLFWAVTALVVLAVAADTFLRHSETQKIINERGYNRAKSIQEYFVSMRFVYHQQFLKSGIDLNDSTVGFLPAHAASLISDEFSKRTTQGVSIRNVSDQPRNPKNRADELELESMKYFMAHPDQNESIKRVRQNGVDFFFFSAPLRVQPYCLACHGEKEKALGYIKNRYTQAYGYKLGDVRGLTSIKIPVQSLANPMMSIFWETTLFSFAVSTLLLALVYVSIKKLARHEELIKEELKKNVEEKTGELQCAYRYEKHLRSILRTVADVNQLLVTAQNIEELIDKSAKALSLNVSFVSVKILLVIDGKLDVKASYGNFDEIVVTEVDTHVFETNKSVIYTNFEDESIPLYCRQKAKLYGIKAVYSAPLRSSGFAEKPLGVLTVCTTFDDGFSDEESSMLDELVGDIGFAVNSFMQKEIIDGLSQERLKSYQEFIEALVDMIEQRDTYTAGHTQRVATYSVMIAKKMCISESETQKLFEAAKLHDIGKVVTPDSVLLKPGALTALEYELIKEHVSAGYRALSNIDSYAKLAQIVACHHEKFDGSGYPYGKSGDEIPILGHILAVADSFDAMTTNRIYKARKSVQESIAELHSFSGSWYHPDVVIAASEALSGVEVDMGIDQAIGVSAVDRERLSYFFKDRLTGLYNEDYLTLLLSGRSAYPKPQTISVVSLVNFTKYNRKHSWEGGNNLLTIFADFLTKHIAESPIFRVWGDRFIIADFNGDIGLFVNESPLIAHEIEYRTLVLKAPFENIKETLLKT